MDSDNKFKSPLVVIVIVIVLVVAGALYWYLAVRQVETEEAEKVLPTGVGVVEEEADLGSEIFDKVTNPIEGKIPEAGATVPNPLEGVYENPFGS